MGSHLLDPCWRVSHWFRDFSWLDWVRSKPAMLGLLDKKGLGFRLILVCQGAKGTEHILPCMYNDVLICHCLAMDDRFWVWEKFCSPFEKQRLILWGQIFPQMWEQLSQSPNLGSKLSTNLRTNLIQICVILVIDLSPNCGTIALTYQRVGCNLRQLFFVSLGSFFARTMQC